MSHRLTVGLVALTLGLPIVPRPVRAQEPLPAATFRLHCFDDGAETTAVEAEGVMALLEFAEAHDGQPVYLDAVIQADAGAGGCSRDLSEFPGQPAPGRGRARITIDPCRVEPRRPTLLAQRHGRCSGQRAADGPDQFDRAAGPGGYS